MERDKQKVYIKGVKINVDNRAESVEIHIDEIESPGWVEERAWMLLTDVVLNKLSAEERRKIAKILETNISRTVKNAVKKALKDDGKANK